MARSLKDKKEYFKKWYSLNKEKCLEKSKAQRNTMPRVLKQEKCSECEKIGIFAKDLCQACYSKSRRKTPEGAKALKLYNDTKGKIAREKYISNKPPKPPKPPKEKQLCKCGNKSIAKGMCRNCYQNERYVPKSDPLVYGRKRRSDSEKKEIYDKVFNLVSKGATISRACIIEKINRNVFYKIISVYQKQALMAYKTSKRNLNDDDYIIKDSF